MPGLGKNISNFSIIHGLHHFAWRCRNAEETRHFYEDVLGLPLVHIIKEDYVPSTGEYCPYVHIFFEMKDGSYIAFFDLGDETATIPDPETPGWVNHLALEVESVDELSRAKSRLEEYGFDVVGPTDHDIIKSIYFFDPNGIRLELTTRTVSPERMSELAREAHAVLAEWTSTRPEPAPLGTESGS